jgi:membrane protein implicated in regulation of membrane protease activity
MVALFTEFFKSDIFPNFIKWGAIAGVLMFVELGHRAWLIIWFALGALSTALFSIFFPDAIMAQFAVFFVVSGGSLAIFIVYRQKQIGNEIPVSIVPKGRKVRCVEEITSSRTGVIILDGVQYKARLKEPDSCIKPDQWVQVLDFDIDDLVAIVEPLQESAPQIGGN